MGDYYQHFLTSMSGQGLHPSHGNSQNTVPPSYHGSSIPQESPTVESHQAALTYFPAGRDPIMYEAAKSKGRKKSTSTSPGVEPVKHRRTRSGCFTCRSRRVKCDERRPICERCSKGNRECIYPEPPTVKAHKSRESATSSQQASPMSSTGDGDDEKESRNVLGTIPDVEEVDDDAYSVKRSFTSPPSVTTSPHIIKKTLSEASSPDDKSSPSTTSATPSSLIAVPFRASDCPPKPETDWSHLSPDLRMHLEWFASNITHYHYGLTYDTDNFFRTILPSLALENKALLNAVVGFAAYQVTLQNPNGHLQDFLRYYNRSISLLLQSLRQKEKPTVTTLLTILQLATVEEYFGDWVNILGHQKAAYELFTSLFSPQTIALTPLGRMALAWYIRFDNFVAIMGGFPTTLSRDYLEAMIRYCQTQTSSTSDVTTWKQVERTMRVRLISWRMSLLYARGSRDQITRADFTVEHGYITQELIEWRKNWDPDLTNPKYLVNDFGSARVDPDNIVNPYEPGVIYEEPLFSSTIANLEWHCLMITHRTLAVDKSNQDLFRELTEHAYIAFQHYEAVTLWPTAPLGLTTIIQAAIPMAAMYLPQDDRHHLWIRRKFALSEQRGYMCPLSIRTKLAELFQDPSCVRWWLPNDEGFSPIIRSIRDFADERNAVAVNAQQESVREIRNLFENLNLGGKGHYPLK